MSIFRSLRRKSMTSTTKWRQSQINFSQHAVCILASNQIGYLQWLKKATPSCVSSYPPLDSSTPDGAVRSAAHEDINFITLLMTATAAGLQVMDHDGTWIDVEGNHEQIIVDSGDMIQNLRMDCSNRRPIVLSIRETSHSVDSRCQCSCILETKSI